MSQSQHVAVISCLVILFTFILFSNGLKTVEINNINNMLFQKKSLKTLKSLNNNNSSIIIGDQYPLTTIEINKLTNNMTVVGSFEWFVLASLQQTNYFNASQSYKMAYHVNNYDIITKWSNQLVLNNSIVFDYTVGWISDCWFGNPFLVSGYNGLIGSEWEIMSDVKKNRDTYGIKINDERYRLDLSDFHYHHLFPYKLLIINNTWYNEMVNKKYTTLEIDNVILNYYNTLINDSLQLLNTSDCAYHDYSWLKLMNGFFNLTNQDIEMINKLNNLKQPVKINMNYYNNLMKQYILNYPNIFDNLSQAHIKTKLYNSTCHFCSTTACIGEPLTGYDIMSIINIILGIFFFIILCCACKLNSIRRRLLLPYTSAILIAFFFALSTDVVYNSCACFSRTFRIMSIAFIICIYIITILRFYYFRNLYSMISKKANKNASTSTNNSSTRDTIFSLPIATHKKLLDTKLGIAVSIIVPFIFSLLFLPTLAYFKDSWLYNDSLVIQEVIVGLLVFISAALGIVCVIIDLFVNRQFLKTRGLRYILFFDDPFYVRVDLLSMVFLELLLIIIVVLSAGPILSNVGTEVSYTIIGIINIITAFVGYMVCGGTAVFIEVIKRLLYKFSKDKDKSGSHILEQILEEPAFYKLIREFAEKDFSVENILLYDKLMALKQKNTLSLSDLEEVNTEFVESGSDFEVNFSYDLKFKFYQLLDLARTYHNNNNNNNLSNGILDKRVSGANLFSSKSRLSVKESSSSDLMSVDEMSEASTTSNTSSKVIGNSTLLKEMSKNRKIYYKDLSEILMPGLMLNILDTKKRLELTKEYFTWQHANEMLKEHGISNTKM
ncbi:hypothetical protein ABK040_014393 [Willaertia magna]